MWRKIKGPNNHRLFGPEHSWLGGRPPKWQEIIGVASPRRAELIPGNSAVLRAVRTLILLSGSRKRLKGAA